MTAARTAAPHRLDDDVPRWQQRDAAWVAAWTGGRNAADPGLRTGYDTAARSGLVLSPADLTSCDLPAADVRRALYGGRWFRPRRGVVCVLSRADALAIGDDGVAQLEAMAAVRLRPRTVISHESAAMVHALPILRLPERPSLTTLGRSSGGEGISASIVRGARLEVDETQTWFGAPVTVPARTVLDIARRSGRRAGLVAADAALHDKLVTPAQLECMTADREHWPGIRAAREVVELADGRAESPLESLTRLLVHDFGLPRAEPQFWINTRVGRVRVDLAWPRVRVIVEADGALKYRTDEDRDALWREKLRQEALERAGWVVVRVTWAEVVYEPRSTAARIAAALFAHR